MGTEGCGSSLDNQPVISPRRPRLLISGLSKASGGAFGLVTAMRLRLDTGYGPGALRRRDSTAAPAAPVLAGGEAGLNFQQ